MVAIPDGAWVDNQTDGPELRKALGTLLAPSAATAPRSGRFAGPGSPLAVQSTSPASMAVLVKAGKGATYRSSTYGPVLGVGPDGDVTVPIPPAPASGSRYSLVYKLQRDPLPPANDGAEGAVVDVVTGDAASTPIRPTLPPGAELLGEVLVPANVSAVTGAMILDKPKYTALRGTPIPVATQDERLALPAYPTASALELDTGRLVWHDGTRWRYNGDRVIVANKAERDTVTAYAGLTAVRLDLGGRAEVYDGTGWGAAADVTLGDAHMPTSVVVAAFPNFTDLATVTATSSGGECMARMTSMAYNGASGADRTITWRVLCDGAEIGSFPAVSLPLANLPRVTRAGAFASTPAAGAHTWKLQASGSAASSVVVDTGLLTVVEKG